MLLKIKQVALYRMCGLGLLLASGVYPAQAHDHQPDATAPRAEHGGHPASTEGMAHGAGHDGGHHDAAMAGHDGHPPMAPGEHHSASPEGMDHGAGHHAAHMQLPNSPVGDAKRVKIQLEDTVLLTQRGEKVHFASDVVGHKLIALNIFYSSCTTVCPVTSAIFADLQALLGERLGREVELVSLTVDPTTDTPRRLKSYSDKYAAKPGWSWLTGQKLAVDKVLNGLGLYTADYTEHPAAVLIGDGERGSWSRFYGFPSAQQIAAELDRFALARHSHPQSSDALAKE